MSWGEVTYKVDLKRVQKKSYQYEIDDLKVKLNNLKMEMVALAAMSLHHNVDGDLHEDIVFTINKLFQNIEKNYERLIRLEDLQRCERDYPEDVEWACDAHN